MAHIDLKYGKSKIPFEYDESQFEILGLEKERAALSDVELGQKLDDPIDSAPLEDIVSPGETVLLVVPDATRQTACGQVVNLVVRRLIANGTTPHEISIIFATGIHRAVTDAEKQAILTPFIAQRIKTLNHGPRDLMQIARLGETSGGIPVELNRALTEHDHVILVGGVTFHYFAGFTGGRKLVCPGLASSKTVSATHKLAFDYERKDRREGVGPGLLDGNAVHEAFMEATAKINPAFAINTIVNDRGDAVDLFCGSWITSHRAACEKYAADHTINIAEKRDIVIVSCGGYPYDINMIQAHKALDAASRACNDGGTIIFLAECSDGLGRTDFLNWFDAANSAALAEKLCENYQVNGQTAWSLLRKAERFDVRVITALDAATSEKMRLVAMQSLARAISKAGGGNRKGYILPNGSKFLARES
ncbi:MAG TPA: nickel-dependent lactate racemase [Pyrinomonadaceae bacterium]|nr:nickel-dependent lactate racemase [Pyrinomonadaceae bacterium]